MNDLSTIKVGDEVAVYDGYHYSISTATKVTPARRITIASGYTFTKDGGVYPFKYNSVSLHFLTDEIRGKARVDGLYLKEKKRRRDLYSMAKAAVESMPVKKLSEEDWHVLIDMADKYKEKI